MGAIQSIALLLIVVSVRMGFCTVHILRKHLNLRKYQQTFITIYLLAYIDLIIPDQGTAIGYAGVKSSTFNNESCFMYFYSHYHLVTDLSCLKPENIAMATGYNY